MHDARGGFGLMLLLLLAGCTCTPVVTGSSPPGVAALWIAADRDAFVQSEPAQSINAGGLSNLNVARSVVPPLPSERSYVRFTLPQLPPGTRVVEAYVNLFENSRVDPATVTIPFTWANADWDPLTITWLNQPNPPGPAGQLSALGAYRDVGQWRGHPQSIHGEIERVIAGVQPNTGFMFHMDLQFASRRSFAADIVRTSADMGSAPRLLLRVANEQQPFSAATVTLPAQLPPTQDLCRPRGPLPRSPTTMVLIAPGPAWPPAWAVATQ
jgi:hypothetical protein